MMPSKLEMKIQGEDDVGRFGRKVVEMNVKPVTGEMYQGCIFRGPDDRLVKLVRVTTTPSGERYRGDFHLLEDEAHQRRYDMANLNKDMDPEELEQLRQRRQLLRQEERNRQQKPAEVRKQQNWSQDLPHSLDWEDAATIGTTAARRSSPVVVKWGKRLVDAEADFVGHFFRGAAAPGNAGSHLPGTISIGGGIVNLYILSGDDADPSRLDMQVSHLCSCLQAIRRTISGPFSLALSHRLPMRASRGQPWPEYLAAIYSFAAKNPTIRITLYDEDPGPQHNSDFDGR